MRQALALGWLLVLACGGATPADDGGEGDAAVDCVTAAEGTACGAGSICVAGTCAVSTCGDGALDSAAGEDCDDGNTIAFDGCTSCRFDCLDNARCDDGDSCTGVERCDLSTHACTAGAPLPPGTDCTSSRVLAGVCRDVAGMATCVSPGCGNGVVDGAEDCDDGANGNQDDGCRDDCRFTCTEAADCDDGTVCNGDELCDTTTHLCRAGAGLDCGDGDDCTADGCDETTGCAHTLIDSDGDGQAPAALGACGTDCNDTNDTIFAGASEACDGVDNDCDGSTDETAPHWYVDCDRDGFAASADGSMQACVQPIGAPSACSGPGTWTNLEPTSASDTDCNDGRLEARPGALEQCNRGDDDCNGLVDEDQLAFATLGTGLRPALRTVHHGAARQLATLSRTTGSSPRYELVRATDSGVGLGTSTVGPNDADDADVAVVDGGYLVAVADNLRIYLYRVDAAGAVSSAGMLDAGFMLRPQQVRVARFGSTDEAAVLWTSGTSGSTSYRWGITRVSASTGAEVPGAHDETFLPQPASGNYQIPLLLTTNDGVVAVTRRDTFGTMAVQELVARAYGPSGAGTLVNLGTWRGGAVEAAYEPLNDALVAVETVTTPFPSTLDYRARVLRLATGAVETHTLGTGFATSFSRSNVGYTGEPGQLGFFAQPPGTDTRLQYARFRVSDGAAVPTPIRIAAGYGGFMLPAVSGPHRFLVWNNSTVGAIDCAP